MAMPYKAFLAYQRLAVTRRLRERQTGGSDPLIKALKDR